MLRLPRKAYVFVMGLAMLPFIFAALPTSWYVREPRYLYFTWPLVVLVVGGALGTFRNQKLALGVLVLIAAGSVASTAVMVQRGESVKGLWDFAPGDLRPVIARLNAEGHDRVFADYWIAYRLALATDEKVIASPLQTIRYQPYETKVRAAESPTYVFFDGSCYEEKFKAFLDGRGVGYTDNTAGIYAIVQPAVRVLPEEALVEWAAARRLGQGHVC